MRRFLSEMTWRRACRAVAVVAALAVTQGLGQITITAHEGDHHTFTGFGGAFHEENNWGNLPQDKRDEMVNLIWGKSELNWNVLKLWTSQWETDINVTLQRYQAAAEDVLKVRPDVRIMISGNTRDPIPDSRVGEWAARVADIAKGLEDNGIPMYLAGVYSEPNAYGKLTPRGVAIGVKDLREELDSRGLEHVKVIAPECSMVDGGCVNMLQAIINDPDALEALDGFATHAYRMNVTKSIHDLLHPHGKEHWQTESSSQGIQTAGFCLSDVNMGVTVWTHFFAVFDRTDEHRFMVIGYDLNTGDYDIYSMFYYYKQLDRTFPAGTRMRLCQSSNSGNPWMYYTNGVVPPHSVAAGAAPDGRMGIAIANRSGASDFIVDVKELEATSEPADMEVNRVNDGGIQQVQDVTLENGKVRVHVGGNEMVTLRSKEPLYEPTEVVARAARPARPAPLRCRSLPDAARIDFSAVSGGDGARLRLTVHGLNGALVATLLDEAAGSSRRAVTWDYRVGGRRVSPGLYVIRMIAGRGNAHYAKLAVRR
jgi:hypothetical protein